MQTIVKFGLSSLVAGVFLVSIPPGNAGTPDPGNPFTKHGLPVPGVYFKKQESRPTAVVVTRTTKSAGHPKQAISAAMKKRTKEERPRN